MKKHSRLIVGLALTLAILLSACNNTPAVTSAPQNTDSAPPAPEAGSTPVAASIATNTPDPCAAENIKAEVAKVHRHMREFDDTSALVTNLGRSELTSLISELQRIRRDAQDQVVPYCLGDLKSYQVSHMNTVINTLITFIGGTDKKTFDQGIMLARQQHDQYTLELARLLGLTVEAATVFPLFTETPTVPSP